MPVAVITGASRGFGRALAVDLAKDGWRLVLDARGAADLHDVVASLTAITSDVRGIKGDICDPRHRSVLIDEAIALGGIDLLVNNASTLGIAPLVALSTYGIEDLRTVFEVNVIAPLALSQLALPALRQAQGVVVALSSDAAVEAYPHWGAYGASKSALDQLHRVLGVEEEKVKIYEFDPGDMRTAMHQAAFPDEDISDRPNPESVVPALRKLIASRPASGRYRAMDWIAK